jgi:signal transduction histidine kinase
MEASQSKSNRISQGLKIMCERAEAFGGTVDIEPAEEKGTKVSVMIPMTGTPIAS